MRTIVQLEGFIRHCWYPDTTHFGQQAIADIIKYQKILEQTNNKPEEIENKNTADLNK